jgi:Spy/CpxP family protein refolding chaperone
MAEEKLDEIFARSAAKQAVNPTATIVRMEIEMKKTLFAIAATLLVVSALAAKEKSSVAETNLTPEQIEANYTRAIEGRTGDILKVLSLNDTNQAAKVHHVIMAQYRALRAWHDANDPKLKAARADTNAVAQIRGSLKSLHDEFIAKLSAIFAPEQVEKVKDKITYGKVQFTYAGYLVAYTNLTEANKQKILELLKEAREQAMDGGSAEEKTAVFQKCKGKINNYLSQQGIHPAKEKTAKPPDNK